MRYKAFAMAMVFLLGCDPVTENPPEYEETRFKLHCSGCPGGSEPRQSSLGDIRDALEVMTLDEVVDQILACESEPIARRPAQGTR